MVERLTAFLVIVALAVDPTVSANTATARPKPAETAPTAPERPSDPLFIKLQELNKRLDSLDARFDRIERTIHHQKR